MRRNALRFGQVGDLKPFVDATRWVLADSAFIVARGKSIMRGSSRDPADVERRGGRRLSLRYDLRQRRSRDAWLKHRCRLLLDFLTTRADQPLIGSDQRHIRVDERPTIFGQYLRVEVQMIGGAELAPVECANLAEQLSLPHRAPAEHTICVKHLRIHVQVAKADVLTRDVDEQVGQFAPRAPQDHAVTNRGHIVLIRQTAVATLVAELAGRGPNVLALVTVAAWTFADQERAMFAEVVAPGVRTIFESRLVENERLAVTRQRYGAPLAPERDERPV